MVVPGFSSQRFPVRFRLYLALGLSVSASSIATFPVDVSSQQSVLIKVVLLESMIGLGFGFIVRLMILAIEVIGEFISFSIGLSNSFSASQDSG